MITGYIIYASEIRKEIIKKNPDKDFGGISKIVGAEWKNLPQETKVTYEKRAQEQNNLSRTLFANESLNKLADVAAARAADAAAAARDTETTRDSDVNSATRVTTSASDEELQANNNGNYLAVTPMISPPHPMPHNGQQMDNTMNGGPICAAASISQVTIQPSQQHQSSRQHCCYICCYCNYSNYGSHC